MQQFARETNDKEDNNGGKTWLDLSSQCDAICEVCDATKKMKMSNAKLATFDLCNNTVEKSAKAHRDSLLLTFFQKRKTKSTLEETARSIENEPRLEKSAIRNMIRTNVNKSTKREVQLALSKDCNQHSVS